MSYFSARIDMIYEGIVYLFQENHVYSQPKRAKYRITFVITGRLLNYYNFGI
ncbi:hypothetical protein [Candidatus Tisiphia endosymbiont of Sialis lutaria]|uniref:hypothetical protein n=1 Tax=Candidatus Tisiphia endosymbiont of Sialis lutaria TaxID=2029164 RepID=UPI00312CB43F